MVLLVRPPDRRTGADAVRGHRVFGAGARVVRGIEVVLGERRFTARRTTQGWDIDGRPADAATSAALHDLGDTLSTLRAIDVFRSRDTSTFGLDRPHATIVLETPRGPRRLAIGDPNAAGSALYARRDGDARIMQVGTGLLSSLERVLYHRDRAQRPEIG
jgi:hypothetical protein